MTSRIVTSPTRLAGLDAGGGEAPSFESTDETPGGWAVAMTCFRRKVEARGRRMGRDLQRPEVPVDEMSGAIPGTKPKDGMP